MTDSKPANEEKETRTPAPPSDDLTETHHTLATAAESLPFEDQSFDAAMAFATVHHWRDPIAGLREMRRVARRVVAFTHDTTDTAGISVLAYSRLLPAS